MTVRIESQAEPIPGYRLVERLGRGGFGEVWKVVAPGGLPKAIKFVLNHDLPGEQKGLGQQELKALNRVKRVRHPYILSLERFDIIDECLIIVMELADRNLADRYKECKEQNLPGIPRDELLRYMEEAAEALDLMNQTYDLQHLDIKPQNLFVVHRHVKVGDFGLVKDLEGLVAPVTGGVTPVYAAPETFEGWVSRFCDQYSLAIVYQELLTGLRPFRGTNPRQLLVQHLQGSPDLSPLPQSDREAIARALAKDPNQRHPSCADLIRALRAAEGRPAPGLAVRPCGDSVANISADNDTVHDSRQKKLALTPESSAYIAVPAPTDSELAQALGEAAAAPMEKTGDGSLFPALVIGIGNQGLQVLRGLREQLAERVVPDSLRQLRMLLLDTDLDTIHAAYDGPGVPLLPEQTFLLKLQRPGYYLRPREWQVPYDSWMPSQTLFRITRNQTTAGIRCLGRLAFCDHYRNLATRLRDELSACLDPEALEAAAEQTKLGIRTNRPRVYLVTSLAGGTGGGMYIDVAYLIGALLKQMGYAHPEIVGILVLPPAGPESALSPELGNAYAALTELHYYSQPDAAFVARYLAKGAPYREDDPPFERCILIEQSPTRRDEASPDAAWLPAAFLTRDLISPLGRAADSCRSAAEPAQRRPVVSTIGLQRFAFPRGLLIEAATQQLCHQLIQRWMVKGAAPVREGVSKWLEVEMPAWQLDTETLMERLRAAAESGSETSAEQAMKAILERFAAEHSSMSLRAADMMRALDEITFIVGKPKDDPATQSAVFAMALNRVIGPMTQECEQNLNRSTLTLVDRPGLRFSGAEEAVNQTSTLLERLVQQVEGLAKKKARTATEACAQILSLAEGLEKSRVWGKLRMAGMRGPLELLQIYAHARYDALLLQGVAAIYQTVLSGRPDLLREIGFYRHRVGELAGAFEASDWGEPALPHGRYVFPGNCQTFGEAVRLFAEAVASEDLIAFDGQIQEGINAKFGSLTQFCLSVAAGVAELEAVMRDKAAAFLEPRLPAKDIAEAYLRPEVPESTLRGELQEAFAAAEPPLPGEIDAGAATCILAMPPSPAGEQFRRLVTQSLTGVSFTVVPSIEEIVFYRERVGLSLADLPQLGPGAHEAYLQMTALDTLTPHSRTDVDWVAPVSGSARTVHMS